MIKEKYNYIFLWFVFVFFISIIFNIVYVKYILIVLCFSVLKEINSWRILYLIFLYDEVFIFFLGFILYYMRCIVNEYLIREICVGIRKYVKFYFFYF